MYMYYIIFAHVLLESVYSSEVHVHVLAIENVFHVCI